MPSNKNDHIVNDLTQRITTVAETLDKFFDEVREHSTSLAVLQDKLENISNTVSSLSVVVREGNGAPSIITRLALIEKGMNDCEEKLEKYKAGLKKEAQSFLQSIKNSNDEAMVYNQQQSLSKWKLAIVVAPGTLALLGQIIHYFLT